MLVGYMEGHVIELVEVHEIDHSVGQIVGYVERIVVGIVGRTMNMWKDKW